MDFDVEISLDGIKIGEAPFGINVDNPPTAIHIEVKGADGQWYGISVKNIRKEVE